jgi:hypothetical protein
MLTLCVLNSIWMNVRAHPVDQPHIIFGFEQCRHLNAAPDTEMRLSVNYNIPKLSLSLRICVCVYVCVRICVCSCVCARLHKCGVASIVLAVCLDCC